MGKQKRGPERGDDAVGAERRVERPALDPSLVDQGMLGNAALQASLDGASQAPSATGLDVVRDMARPIVDHAALVLQITRSPLHDRLVDILVASRLPDDRRQVLLDRLNTSAAAAGVVHAALIDAFGRDTPELRAALSDTLDGIHADLGGRDVDGAWDTGDRRVALSDAALDGAPSDRAGALVRDLVATPSLEPEGVRAFCLAVHLALTLDEEEDEEWAAAPLFE